MQDGLDCINGGGERLLIVFAESEDGCPRFIDCVGALEQMFENFSSLVLVHSPAPQS